MLNLTDKDSMPDIKEIGDFIENPLFFRLTEYMKTEFKAHIGIEYSGDKILLGWNIRFYKSGRTLLRLYPKKGFFTVLIVVGRREKERVEEMLSEMTAEIRDLYNNTKEGMGQRWLLTDLSSANEAYNDIIKLVKIRSTK